MKYQQVRDAIDRIENARMDLDAGTKSLRAIGVTDLPGDAPAPRCLNHHFPPGNLPGEPTDAMIEAAMHAQPGGIQPAGIGLLSGPELARILRAALAAAPRVEVPEVTPDDVRMAIEAWHTQDGLLDDQIECALRNFRARLNARMGAKS